MSKLEIASNRTVPAYRTYAEQLLVHHHGLPLWIPESRNFGEVQVGDVGYISEGAFYRLFNIMHPENSPANSRGVPEGFVPVEGKEEDLIEKNPRFINPGAVFAAQFIHREVNASVSATMAPSAGTVEARYAFTCHSDRGAVAVLGDYGEQHRLVPGNYSFPDYMAEHYIAWQKFAYDRLRLNLVAEDIVLVSGWVKTSDWEIAAIDKRMRSQELAAEATVGSFVAGRLSFSSQDGATMSVSHRSRNPVTEGNATDKGCLFLRYFKLKRRSKFLGLSPSSYVSESISARDADPPHNQGRRTPSDREPRRPSFSPTGSHGSSASSSKSGTTHTQCSDDGEYPDSTSMSSPESGFTPDAPDVVEELNLEPLSDPLDYLLDYIMNRTDADIAIVHHDDLYSLCDDNSWPKDLAEHIADVVPKVVVRQGYGHLWSDIYETTATANALVKGEVARQPSVDNHVLAGSDDLDIPEDPHLALTSQTLNPDGTPKRPMNAFMIFARKRRPQISAANQMMATGDISKILSKEWNAMEMSDKKLYLDQAKKLKDTFNNKYPDYVYRRRPNNSRKKRKPDQDPHSPTDQSAAMHDNGDALLPPRANSSYNYVPSGQMSSQAPHRPWSSSASSATSSSSENTPSSHYNSPPFPSLTSPFYLAQPLSRRTAGTVSSPSSHPDHWEYFSRSSYGATPSSSDTESPDIAY